MSNGRQQSNDETGQIKHTIEQTLSRCRGMAVGRVTRFTAGSATAHPTCSVLVLTPRFVDDGPPLYDDVLDDVPVGFFGTRRYRHDFALTDGDLVLLIVSEKTMDAVEPMLQSVAIQDPDQTDPQSPRMHDISDAFAIPIATYTGKPAALDFLPYPAPPTLAVPRDEFAVDLIRIVIQAFEELQTAQTATMLGPQTFIPIALERLAELGARISGTE